MFTVDVDGDADRARNSLLDQSWVDDVSIAGEGSSVRLTIATNDVDQAEARLQRVLLEDPDLVVKGFTRQSASLEDIFIDLVEEGPANE